VKEIVLPPIREFPEDYEKVEAQIMKLFRDEIFLPLIREVGAPRNVLRNSTDDLLDAIRSGRISFYRGQFSGRFNATISKELKRLGARWDRKNESWTITRAELPVEVSSAISASESRFSETRARLDKKLAQLLPEEIAAKLKIEKIFDSTLWKVEKEFRATLKGITVPPDLTPERRARIAAEYTENLQLYIRKWTDEQIVELRGKLQRSAFHGFRYEGMVKMIERSYGVSQSKAKFLARQETSLLMTKYKQSRYEDAGVNEYRWGCVAGSPNHPVRPMHRALEGKTFSWNNPPITNDKGERNNPGQDFNCRCFARPIVKFS
jgi:SPP1 gp7 family putative phage head morphogenesis protein